MKKIPPFLKKQQLNSLKKAIELAGGQAALARLCGPPVTQAHVWNWLHRDKRVSANYIAIIEKALDGRVKKSDLRPELYD